MSKVLVTGAAGFVGRHLTRRLLDAGHEVHAVDSIPTHGSPGLYVKGVQGIRKSALFTHRWDAAPAIALASERQSIRCRQGYQGRKLHKRMLAIRAHLFVFMTNRAVPYTNNVSKRHLWPSVIFHKVTNGFRCEWGAETYAAFRSVVSTAKASGASVLDTVHFVLTAKPSPGLLRRWFGGYDKRDERNYTTDDGIERNNGCGTKRMSWLKDGGRQPRNTEEIPPTDPAA